MYMYIYICIYTHTFQQPLSQQHTKNGRFHQKPPAGGFHDWYAHVEPQYTHVCV